MSGVSEELPIPLHKRFGVHVVVTLSVLVFLAGPGFFAAALFIALHRDVPSAPPAHATAKPRTVATHVQDSSEVTVPGGLLSPVAQRLSPGLDRPLIPTAVNRASVSPVEAYLSLTGSSNGSNLVADNSEPAEQGYRTVCVRLCDGSYFPISERALPSDFAADETQCRSRCGSPARLFVYKNGHETPLQMRDLSGRTYLELPTAFLFHTGYDAQCTCRSQPWTVASRQRHDRYADLKAAKKVRSRLIASPANLENLRPEVSRPLSVARTLSSIARTPSLPAASAAPRLLAAVEAGRETASIKATTATTTAANDIEAVRIRDERIARVLARTDLLASLELPELAHSAHSPGLRKESAGKAASRLKPATVMPFALGGPAAISGTVKVAGLTVAERPVRPPSATDILMRNINPHY